LKTCVRYGIRCVHNARSTGNIPLQICLSIIE